MDRGIWTAALIGFLAPVVVFSPLNSAKSFVTSFLDAHRAAVTAPPAPLATFRMAPYSAPHRTPHLAGNRANARVARAPASKPLDPKDQLARTIDPATRPDWHLIDPTLKKGDVLFLRNRVLVFKGPTIGKLSNYVPVRGTKLLSGKERRLIEAMSPRAGDAPVAAARKPFGATLASTPAAPAFDLRIHAN